MIRHRCILPTVTAVFGLFGCASAAQAGWVTITNETKQVIVIQETSGPQNRPIRGKCAKLQPGETYREYHQDAGTKNVQVYDAAAPNTALIQDQLKWDKTDAEFAVKNDGKKVTLTAGVEKKDDKGTTAKK
jgi:hypothetical protein